MSKSGLLLTSIALIMLLAGCSSMWDFYSGGGRRGVSSSLVDYLYADGQEPPPYSDAIPQLNVPLRVGLAFVPPRYEVDKPVLSEASNVELLNRVRDQFEDRNYISEIEIIPDAYMRGSRGFTSLEQLARLHNLDVMALVSYDQVVTSEDTAASFLYWTVVGAYLIEGSRNEVQTFVDTAVFDIPTHKLLLRAPGIDREQSKSTLAAIADGLRQPRMQGFSNAMEDMSKNLAVELERFEERINDGEKVATVVSRGGGIIDIFSLALLGLLLLGKRRRFDKHRFAS